LSATETLHDAIGIFEMAETFCRTLATVACRHLTFPGQDLNFACIPQRYATLGLQPLVATPLVLEAPAASLFMV
jgi:hypothetical protein